MAVLDPTKKEINLKILYYGPARSGKTTSIKQLHKLVGAKKKSPVKKHPETRETLFFDFLALSSDALGGYKTRFQVYTVPGQVLFDDNRKLLLKGVDGIIFVADSGLDKVQENIRSIAELRGNLMHMGYGLNEIPMVIQYNKRDLGTAPPVDELRRILNDSQIPDFETVATKGTGVLETFKECVRQVVATMKNLQ